MKDISDIFASRLQRLERSFCKEWIGDFHSMMKFAHTDSFLKRIIRIIEEEKEIVLVGVV